MQRMFLVQVTGNPAPSRRAWSPGEADLGSRPSPRLPFFALLIPQSKKIYMYIGSGGASGPHCLLLGASEASRRERRWLGKGSGKGGWPGPRGGVGMRRWRRRGCHFSCSFFFSQKKKKVFLSRETAAQTILEEVGRGGGSGSRGRVCGCHRRAGGHIWDSCARGAGQPGQGPRTPAAEPEPPLLQWVQPGVLCGGCGRPLGCMRPCRAARDGDLGCGPDSSLARSARCPAPSWMLGGQRQNPEPALGPRGTD